jgi:hypothetical protein
MMTSCDWIFGYRQRATATRKSLSNLLRLFGVTFEAEGGKTSIRKSAREDELDNSFDLQVFREGVGHCSRVARWHWPTTDIMFR